MAGVDKNRVLSNSESNTILHYSFIYLFVIYMIRSSLIRVFMRRVYHFKYPFHASRTNPVLPTQARIAMECDPPVLATNPRSLLPRATRERPRSMPGALLFAAVSGARGRGGNGARSRLRDESEYVQEDDNHHERADDHDVELLELAQRLELAVVGHLLLILDELPALPDEEGLEHDAQG